MKSIYLKFGLGVSPASSMVKLGYVNSDKTRVHYKINNIPDNISTVEVCHKFCYTYLANRDIFELDYDQIGYGKIIH